MERVTEILESPESIDVILFSSEEIVEGFWKVMDW